MFLLPDHKCREKAKQVSKREAESGVVSVEQFNSFCPVFVTFWRSAQDTVKESEFWKCCQNKPGVSLPATPGPDVKHHQQNINHIRTTESKYHISSYVFLPVLNINSYLSVYASLSIVISLSMSWNQHPGQTLTTYFLCWCLLLTSCQGAVSAADDWQRRSYVNNPYCIWNAKCQYIKNLNNVFKQHFLS